MLSLLCESIEPQNACDDGGFEEVSLEEDDSSHAATAAAAARDDFREFNAQFPMRRYKPEQEDLLLNAAKPHTGQ